ncbi:TetR/AcrR family transcriptional regulator [Pseudonocardia sp. NPDC049635]|uniref:TetR/AcrR family transcriptional regulator n=1 Tax=Pseudonocardia sp. NPDC049635 TaxID=3155506 RepID=UPI0033E82185
MRSEKSPSGQKRRSAIEEVRRAQIIDSAVATFAEFGYAQTSLARIAERAGISKGVIAYHFAGRDNLVEQVVDHLYQQIIEFVVPHVSAESTAVGRLRARIRAVAAYMRTHPAQMVALSVIFDNLRDENGRLRYGDAVNEPYYRSLEDVFRAGQESGELRTFDTRVMAVTVQAAIDAMVAYTDSHPEHDIERHAEELGDLFERAVVATPQP